jgi:hypothetical protein
MATVVNDRDVLIMGTTPRYTPPTDRGMFLTPSTAVFKLSADGLSASPSSFQFVATLLNMTGTVTWSTTGGISLVTNGNVATLNFASFTAVSGTITANITVDGQQYTQTATVTKLADGAAGPQGSRGNVDISAVTSGSIWSDSEAAAALAAAGYGAPQVRDLVNLYRADRTFSAQRMYNGSAWIAIDYVWNGNVFVKGSILPEAIDTRGLTIRDAAGNIILNAGMTLAQQTATSPNLVPRISSWSSFSGGAACGYSSTDPNLRNGEYLLLPTGSGLMMGSSPALNIPAGSTFTVSFDAYCTGAASTLVADVYNGTIDTAGIAKTLTNTLQHYVYTDSVAHASSPTAWLRVFSSSPASNIVVTNIKVEIGPKDTPWCDDIITSANVSTFIAAAAIGTAQIAQAAITSALIGDAQITTAKIGDAQISTAKIADGNITTAKIGDAQITGAKIGSAQIGTAHIGDAQITSAKIGDAQVDTLRLAGQSVTIPVSAFTAGSISRGAAGQSTVAQSVGIVSSGAPIVITMSLVITYDSSSSQGGATVVTLRRDATAIASMQVGPGTNSENFSYTVQDTPGAGLHTYDITVLNFASLTNRSIVLLETKR